MKNKLNVSIGIPAYNEAKNIKNLLQSLLTLEGNNFVLKEIILISDGSTDQTVEIARSFKNKKIVILDDKKRLGKSARINTICRMFKGDVLVLADADIVIKDPFMIGIIANKVNMQKAGIVGINATPLPSSTVFEQIIDSGVLVMKDVAGRWRNANNYLSFKGCFLALDRKLAQSISLPSDCVNNDAYLYFAAVNKGYTPAYVHDVRVYYRSPMRLKDHISQAARHQISRKEMERYFQKDLTEYYKIPVSLILTSTIKYMLLRPFFTISYLGIRIVTRLGSLGSTISSTWHIAESTKKISYE